MKYVPGLEGVVVGETSISHVEGEIGRLSYRGYPIEAVTKMDYLEAVYLVLFGARPKPSRLEALSQFMTVHGKLTQQEQSMVKNIPTYAHPMMVVQAMIPLLELDESLSFEEADEHCVLGLQVIAKYPALICAISQSRGGLGNTALYSEEQVYLERFLTMFTGQRPTSRALEIFKTTQSLQIDHSFNAGTFASRVISSTLASVPSVLAGGAGALSGRLHGGADEAALLFAREVDTPGNAQLCVDEVLKNKGRIMGMGHREYRTIDPRAKILKPMAIELCKGSCFENDLETLMAIEAVFNARMAEKGKEVWANVDFYKGVTYEALGIGPDYFTTIFSMSRSVGWLAHFMESRVNNKIIRPAADYVGSLVSAA